MNNLISKIDEFFSSQSEKINSIESGTIKSYTNKVELFKETLEYFERDFKHQINHKIENKKLDINQVEYIKNYLEEKLSEFLINSKIPGINTNYKFQVK